MNARYYRPRRKADLRNHLLRDHSSDVIRLDPAMKVADLSKLHDRLHAEREIARQAEIQQDMADMDVAHRRADAILAARMRAQEDAR